MSLERRLISRDWPIQKTTVQRTTEPGCKKCNTEPQSWLNLNSNLASLLPFAFDKLIRNSRCIYFVVARFNHDESSCSRQAPILNNRSSLGISYYCYRSRARQRQHLQPMNRRFHGFAYPFSSQKVVNSLSFPNPCLCF